MKRPHRPQMMQQIRRKLSRHVRFDRSSGFSVVGDFDSHVTNGCEILPHPHPFVED